MTKLFYFFRAALSGVRQSPFVHAVAAVTIAVALFAGGFARFGLVAAARLLASWGSEVEVTLYLKEGTTEQQGKALAATLREETGGEVRYVPAAEALARLRADLGEPGRVLEHLPKNPLLATLEIRPNSAQRSAGSVAALTEAWAKLPNVELVDYGKEWVDNLESLSAAARTAGLLIFAVVLIAAVIVISATLQLGIYARREEIEIQKLVGATNSFVKAPFLIEGMLQGIAGALLASLWLLGFERYFGPRLAEALTFASATVQGLSLIDLHAMLELGAVGMFLGLTGSLLAVGRFLRV